MSGVSQAGPLKVIPPARATKESCVIERSINGQKLGVLTLSFVEANAHLFEIITAGGVNRSVVRKPSTVPVSNKGKVFSQQLESGHRLYAFREVPGSRRGA